MRKSKAALFLMELLIVLLFFSIACGVCLQLFAYAHLTNKNSKALSDANAIFTNVAEKFYSSDDYSDIEQTSIYYDYHLQECSKDSASFVVSILTTENESITTCHISIINTEDGTEYISQDVSKYERRTLKDE